MAGNNKRSLVGEGVAKRVAALGRWRKPLECSLSHATSSALTVVDSGDWILFEELVKHAGAELAG
jgi:hypothetical protein